MTDLEGRSLDEALARAMGWTLQPCRANHGKNAMGQFDNRCAGNTCWESTDGSSHHVLDWHASLDALLRDIEPVCRERGMLRLSIEQAGENLWNAFAKMRSGMSQYEHGTGPTAATALARAFLAVLTRGER